MSPIHGILASSNRTLYGGSFESIATITATGGETRLSFNSIPSTYKHLQIRGIVKDTITTGTTSGDIRVSPFAGYNHWITGTYSGNIFSTPAFMKNSMIDSSTGKTDMYGAFILDIHDYASATKYKTAKYIAGNTSNGTFGYSGISMGSMSLLDTNPISYLNFDRNELAFAAGTTIALYGIKG